MKMKILISKWTLLIFLFLFSKTLFCQETKVIPLNLPNHNYGETEVEKEIFSKIIKHIEILQENGMVLKDDSLQNYVEGILEKVLPDALKSFEIKTYIIKDPSINAGMYANGIMVVHTGLLATLSSEAELAFVISHELAHFIYRHSLLGHYHDDELIEKYKKKNRKKKGEEDKVQSKIWEYSRALEEEADSLGMAMYMATDYKVSGAKNALEALPLPEYYTIEYEGIFEMFFDDATFEPLPTHPKNKDRIAFIKSIQVLKEGNYLGKTIHKPFAIQMAQLNMEFLRKQGLTFELLKYLKAIQKMIPNSPSTLYQEIQITKGELYYEILESPQTSGSKLYFAEQKAKGEAIKIGFSSNQKVLEVFERHKPELEKKALATLIPLLEN